MSEIADYRHIDKKFAKETEFPAQINTEYRVYFTDDAYGRMRRHVDTTNEVELLGVLLGEVCRDGQGFFLKITAIIEGKDTNNQGAQVTLTHQAWDHINSVKDREYPKERIVGWYHTHPGFGIFLSGMDLFIQNSYFNHPFQVAIVVETKKNQEGCFAWVNGKCTPMHRYWVGSREVELATGKEAEVNLNPHAMTETLAPIDVSPQSLNPRYDEERSYSGSSGGSGLNLSSILMTIIMLICGFMFGKMSSIQDAREHAINTIDSELYSILEYAASNTSAAQDLLTANNRLNNIGAKLQKGDTAGATADIHDLSASLESNAKTYEKHRSDFRQRVESLAVHKQGLAERFSTSEHRQDILERIVANLYLARACDIADKQKDDPSKLTDTEKRAIKESLDKVFSVVPDGKEVIEQKYPKLLAVLYPENKPANSSQTEKSSPENGTQGNGKQ